MWSVWNLFMFISVAIVNGLIEDRPMPRLLYECFYNQTSKFDITVTPSYSVFTHCRNFYWSKTSKDRYYVEIDPSVYTYIQKLEGKLEMHRTKRQARRWRPVRRRRREIRTLTDAERQAVFDAILALKLDFTVRPNAYDALANLHNGAAVQSAHFGPNFLGWHRYFMYIFEQALMTKNPSVTLPYWDSTLDFNMQLDDPVDSIVWTDQFFGPGNGFITSGPFRNFRDINNGFVVRNIGSPGSLMTPAGFRAVMSRIFTRDIVQPTSSGLNDLEGQHNNVHAWIGGHMAGLTTSAFDPVFFFHHCFIDYIWEQFRVQQLREGVNPQNDYPNTGVPGHWPWSTMINLGRIRNIDGYHNAFTQFIYEYEPTPTCPRCGRSRYLECDSTRNVCISTTRRHFMESTFPQGNSFFNPFMGSMMRNNERVLSGSNALEPGVSPIDSGKSVDPPVPDTQQFTPSFIDPRTQKKGRRVKRAISNGFSRAESSIAMKTPHGYVKSGYTDTHSSPIGYKKSNPPALTYKTSPLDVSVDRSDESVSPGNSQESSKIYEKSEFIDKTVQNTFILDGVADVDRWGFAPVKIIHKRPPESSFDCEVVKRGFPMNGPDFYSSTHYKNLYYQASTGFPATFSRELRTGSGASKVFVQSDGLTYNGHYVDYAIIDERHPVSEMVTYVGFKHPRLGPSQAYVSAYDANGRVCKPRCLIPRTNPPQYKVCSGVISVTDVFPKMFGDSYGDAVLNRYSFLNANCPRSKDEDIFLVFYCDFDNRWPWIS